MRAAGCLLTLNTGQSGRALGELELPLLFLMSTCLLGGDAGTRETRQYGFTITWLHTCVDLAKVNGKKTDTVPSSQVLPTPRLRLTFTVIQIPSLFTLFFCLLHKPLSLSHPVLPPGSSYTTYGSPLKLRSLSTVFPITSLPSSDSSATRIDRRGNRTSRCSLYREP